MDVIFDSPNLQVLHRIGRTDTAWITFAASDSEGAFGDRFVEGRGDTGVFFIPKADHWYQCPDIWAALRAAYLATAGRRRITYGSSKGGFAALAYARDLRADLIIAAAPQVSIHPDDVAYFDTRWTDIGRRLTGGRRDARSGAGVIPRVLIFDPTVPEDRTHAALIGGRHIRIPLAGHAALHALRLTGELRTVIGGLADGDDDAVFSALQSVRARQRQTAHYHLALAERAMRRGNHRAASAAACRAAKFDPANAVALSILADCMAAGGNADAAVELARLALSHEPTNVSHMMSVGNYLIQGGRSEEALAFFEAMLDAAPNSPPLLSGYATTLQLKGQAHYAQAAALFRRAFAAVPVAQWLDNATHLEGLLSNDPINVDRDAGGGGAGRLGEEPALATCEGPEAQAGHHAVDDPEVEQWPIDVWYGLKVPHC